VLQTQAEAKMGLGYGKLVIKNARKPDLQAVEVVALADSGSNFLRITSDVQSELQLEEIEKRDVVLADGSKKSVPYVGPIELHFKNRTGFCRALVLGNQVLLGAVPMEDLDLIVIPSTRTVEINPANPDRAGGVMMYFTEIA
jgi:clan AA aspartic protease